MIAKKVINNKNHKSTSNIYSEIQNYYSFYGGPITLLTYRTYPTVPLHLLGFYSIDPLRIYGISPSQHIGSGGKGLNYDKAYASAIGEAIERISASFSSNELPQRLEPLYSTGSDLKKRKIPFLGPDKIFLFHERQYKEPNFPYSKFTLESKVTWVKGELLTETIGTDDNAVYAPAQVVLFLYESFVNEDHISYTSSNGLAVHEKFEIALTSAIMEYIERDAIQVGWYSKIFPYTIVDSLEDILDFAGIYLEPSELAQLKRRYGCIVNLWKTDLPIYVFSVILYLKYLAHNKYAIGFGAGTDPATALKRALEEVFQVREGMNALAYLVKLGFRKPSILPEARREEIDSLVKTLEFYGYERNFTALISDFFLKGEALKLSSAYNVVGEINKERLGTLRKLLNDLNISVIYFNLTPEHLDSSIKTVKVFLPELTMLGGSKYPFLGHPRFYELPKKLGLTKKPLEYTHLNKKPAPF